MKEITFKTIKPTGKYRSFYKPDHQVKLNGACVGSIDPDTFKITLMVVKKDINEDGNPNCPFKNVRLAAINDTLDNAKLYLNTNFEQINNLGIYIRS